MGGSRIGKSSPRIRAYGSYDELGAHLGVAEALGRSESADLGQLLLRLEHELFIVQSELATPPKGTSKTPRVTARHVERLEAEIDHWSTEAGPMTSFVLQRGSPLAAQLHVCRTVARRAERELWQLHASDPQRPELLQWANRLSDLLFAVALVANRRAGITETPPDYDV